MATNAVCATTPITTKLLYNGSIRRFKIPLKDCGANTLPGKLRELLSIPDGDEVIFERWSDSAASYVVLDSNKPAIYKQLYRAAKAKLKLRIKVTHLVPEATLPQPGAMASSDTLVQRPEPIPAVVPMDKLTEAVAAYLDGEEGKTKLRNTIGEEVEKEIEKRSVLSQSIFSSAVTGDEKTSALHITNHQAYAVYCNMCSANIGNVHYHCDICDDGDFDLCESCSLAGQHCLKPEHWMIKRTIINGEVTSSTTQICRETPICSKPAQAAPVAAEEAVNVDETNENDRTCNCCCEDAAENNFVECTVCDDYDLCLSCHGMGQARHGHDPSHEFKPASSEMKLTSHEQALLAPGRNFRHFAICDGCDKQVYGVRHKCFTCPDWDLCSTCYKSVNEIHPGHRFATIYGALGAPGNAFEQHHYGIYCDGPHCTAKGHYNWIRGVRYKCAICPDFDLCARCEASPHNKHNSTHPLIKFRTPIRSVTVQTVQDGQTLNPMGDPVPLPRVATNSSTSVQTVAEVKPIEEVIAPSREEEAEAAASVAAKPQVEDSEAEVKEKDIYVNDRGVVLLSAHYIEDTIADGSVFKAGTSFTQSWTLSNEGTIDWPVGTSLHFIGGDQMGATDMTTTSAPVQPGQRASFSVSLTAPQFVDRNAIGYWGLITPCGVRFGQQLWVEIEVARQIKEEPKDDDNAVSASSPVAKEDDKLILDLENVKSTAKVAESVKDVESSASQDLLTASHTSDMIFPTLDKESNVASADASVASLVDNVAPSASFAPAPAAPSTTGSAPLQFDDVSDIVSDYSIGDDDLEVFISDDEDFEVLTASDDEDFSSSASSTV